MFQSEALHSLFTVNRTPLKHFIMSCLSVNKLHSKTRSAYKYQNKSLMV